MSSGQDHEAQGRRFAEGYVELLGGTLMLAIVVLALLRGWLDLAYVVIAVMAGLGMAKLLAEFVPYRTLIKTVAACVGIICVLVAALGIVGVLPMVQVGGRGLWIPLFSLLAAFSIREVLELPKRTEVEKFRMMLQLYPPSDGAEWTPRKMEQTSDGEVSAAAFAALRAGKGKALGPSWQEIAALSKAMRFPYELWYRKIEWWEKVYADWSAGADVEDKLQEWDYETLDGTAKRLGVTPEEVLQMIATGEIEGRKDREGRWQVREWSVFEQEVARREGGPPMLPPVPRAPRTTRTD